MDELKTIILNETSRLNEQYIEVSADNFRTACVSVSKKYDAPLRLMFAADERAETGCFRVYAVFSIKEKDGFVIVNAGLKDKYSYPSITPDIPAAHWYEREIQDMFGLKPEGHPSPGRLVLHESFPSNSYPLRKDWAISYDELRKWSEGIVENEPYKFMKVEGEGIFEIPVGPVHAGIIEPGHFRFSAIGETIFFLDAKLFYTHKGTEKLFESIGFENGVRLAERVSGTSSFSHSSAYCMAVERMCGAELPQRSIAARTLLIEMERLYNHVGDIGNMCAGTGLAVGYAKGALIKEELMQLNERVTGSRYLRGVNAPGGLLSDPLSKGDDINSTLDRVTDGYKQMMDMLLQSVSHLERMETTGILSKEIAGSLGVTGIAARASGINDDLRSDHPHLLYDALHFESNLMAKGDVFARMMARAADAECSVSMIRDILSMKFSKEIKVEVRMPGSVLQALGYAESPRGSLFYWVKSDNEGRLSRVKLRSPSFCNWPAMPFAVHGNIVPDFPLCNKSFNLSYSGCDM